MPEYTRAEIEAEKARRKQNQMTSGSYEYTREEIEAEKARRKQPSLVSLEGMAKAGIPGAQMLSQYGNQGGMQTLKNIPSLAKSAFYGFTKAPVTANLLMSRVLGGPEAEARTKNLLSSVFPSKEEQQKLSRTPGSSIAEFGGELASFPMIEAAAAKPALGFASKLMQQVAPELAEKAPLLLKEMARGGVTGAATTPFYAAPDQTKESAITGGIVGAALPGVLSPFAKRLPIGEKYDKLREAQNLLKDTPYPIPALTEGPGGKITGQMENVLAYIPGSGLKEKYEQAGKRLNEEAAALLKEMSGGMRPEESALYIQEGLRRAEKDARSKAGQAYQDVENYLKNKGLEPSIPKNNYKNAIEDMMGTEITSYPEASKLVNENIANFGKEASKFLEKPATFTDARRFIEGLNKRMRNASDRAELHYLKSLKTSIDKDIQEGVMASGDEGLLNLWKNARNTYATEYAPFLERDIQKHISVGANPEKILPSFIKSGKAGDTFMAEKLLSKLPNDKAKIAHAHLLRNMTDEAIANDELTVLLRNYRAFKNNPAMKRKLFSPEQIKRMDMLDRLQAGIPEMFTRPNTGARNLDEKGLLKLAAMGALGYKVGGPLGALGSIGLGVGGANMLTKTLTSPGIRKMMLKEVKGNIPKYANLLAPIATGEAYND